MRWKPRPTGPASSPPWNLESTRPAPARKGSLGTQKGPWRHQKGPGQTDRGKRVDPHPVPVAVTSTAEGREPNADVAQGEAVQVPGPTTRDLLGLGAEKPGELPLEAQPRVLPDDALADCLG